MGIKSCCFTGHRKVADPKALENELRTLITNLVVNEGVTDFYCGGAMGFDTVSEFAVIKVKFEHPHIRLHLVLPCCAEEQTAKWPSEAKLHYNIILNRADTVELVSQHYYNGCMKKRNQRLVDLADCCICYYNENDSISGTGQTVRLAQKKGIKIINLFPQ